MATTAKTRTFERFEIAPLTPVIGAEIAGVDIGSDLSSQIIDDIYQALLTYKVIFFRDQDITQEQHIAFARRFGELEIHPPRQQTNQIRKCSISAPSIGGTKPVKAPGNPVMAPIFGIRM